MSNTAKSFFFQAEDGIRDRNVTGVQTCALPIWVNIEVTDLFANVPARLKFLKSDATEVAAIRDVVSALALLHPHVKFHLTVDGRLSRSEERRVGKECRARRPPCDEKTREHNKAR